MSYRYYRRYGNGMMALANYKEPNTRKPLPHFNLGQKSSHTCLHWLAFENAISVDQHDF